MRLRSSSGACAPPVPELAEHRKESMSENAECPVPHGRAAHPTQGGGNRQWWPDRLNLKILAKNPAVANPLGAGFSYADAFRTLDLAAVKRDIADVLTTSQDWWPADY